MTDLEITQESVKSFSTRLLIDQLIAYAYDSGYYSGKKEDGQPHHKAAIEKRRVLQREVMRRMTGSPV